MLGAVRIAANTDTIKRTAALPAITSFTVMGWVLIPAIVLDRAIFTLGPASGTVFAQLLAGSASGTTLSLWNGTAEATTTGTITANAWMHVALTGTSSTLTAYRNGLSVGTQAHTLTTQPVLLQVGGDPAAAADFCPASYGALKVFTRALSAAEVAIEMRDAAPVTRAGLNGFYPIQLGTDALLVGGAARGTATRLADASGLGRDFTLAGRVTYVTGPSVPYAPVVQASRVRRLAVAGGAITGSGTAALPLVATGTGAVTISGTGTTALSLGAVGTGVSTLAGSGTAALPLVASGTGAATLAGAGSATLPLSASGSGASTLTGSGSKPLALVASGTGQSVVTGAGSAVLTLSATGAGTAAITGSGATVLPLHASGTGAVGLVGTGTAVLPLGASGTGTLAALGSITGTGTAVLPLHASGTGTLSIAGSGARPLALVASGVGATTLSGSGTAALPLSAHGSAAVAITGAGTAALPMAAQGSGVAAISGAGASALPLRAVGTGTLTPLAGAAVTHGTVDHATAVLARPVLTPVTASLPAQLAPVTLGLVRATPATLAPVVVAVAQPVTLAPVVIAPRAPVTLPPVLMAA